MKKTKKIRAILFNHALQAASRKRDRRKIDSGETEREEGKEGKRGDKRIKEDRREERRD